MSLERRLSSIEEALNADEPLCILVTYVHDEPGTDPQPLTAEQLERARDLFRQAREADPEARYHVIYLNTPAPDGSSL